MTDQVKYTNKLQGIKALVIGGSSGEPNTPRIFVVILYIGSHDFVGIGFAVAEALVEYGATVTLSSSNPSRVESTVSKLQADYPSAKDRIAGHACDLGSAQTAEANIAALFKATGPLDHIVYTAGDALATIPVSDYTAEKILQAGQTRFVAPLLVAKYASKYLSPGPKSSITFTSGSVAERPIPGWAVIGGFAAGMQGIVRGLAVDLKPIRVNSVQPGATDTNIFKQSGFPEEAKQAMFKEWSEKFPVGKIARPETLAEAYIYLIRDENITGENINSSGGMLIV